jgi:uncharacterized protein (TIGR00251 family)
VTRRTRDADRTPRASSKTVLLVHVQPRASRTEVVGRHGDAIKIRVAAPPVDGAANDELVRFLAGRLGVRRARVRVAAGMSSREKRIEIDGLDGAAALQRLGVRQFDLRAPAG